MASQVARLFELRAQSGIFLVMMSIAFTWSCAQSPSFKASGSRAGVAGANAMSVQIKCGDTKIQVDKKLLAAAGGRLQLSGELCPVSSSSVHILFVLDFSDSMRTNDPTVGVGAAASCGRSKAVSAIIEKMTASRGKDDKVSASIVGFGTAASEVSGEVDLAQFKPSAEALCRSNSGSTNYRAAFELAAQKLAASTKTAKIMYFISDGLPTAGGIMTTPVFIDPFDPYATINAMNQAAAMNQDVHFRAGVDAAASLRSQFPAMVFNAMLLQSAAVALPYDPAVYLSQLTNDASRVRIVSQASQLAESAVQLLTVPVSLDAGNVDASVSNDSGARETLTMRQLLQSQDTKSKWIFGTSDFKAEKIAGSDFSKPIHFAMEASETGGRKHALKVDIEIK